MAIVFVEGWDHLSAAQTPVKGWTASPGAMLAGRFGGQAASCNSQALRKPLPGSYTELYCGFAFKVVATTFGTAAAGFFFSNSGATIVQIGTTTSAGGPNQFAIYNSAGSVIASGTTNIVLGIWYYVEAHALVNGASGSVSLKLNGSSEIANTTVNIGSTAINSVAIATDAGGRQWVWDDMYTLDTTGAAPRNTFLGDVRIATVMPTSDGAHSQFTQNTGASHFGVVDELQPTDDTDYVSDGTPGDIDTYGFSDIDTAATVYGVQSNLYARKDDAQTRQIADVIRQSGTDYVGSTQTLGSNYQFYRGLYNQDPTGSDWTPTSVNADEFGVKLIA